MLVSYIDEVAHTDDLLTIKNFHLNIENFEVNDSKLLLADATVGKDSPEEVVQYLQKKINNLKKYCKL